MAQDAFNGLSLLSGLPVKNGLAPLADDLVDSPTAIVCVVATMRVKDLVAHVENDTTTAVLKLQQIEALTGRPREQALALLAKAREDRTGEKAMISDTGEIVVEESPEAERVTGGDAPDKPLDQATDNVRTVQFSEPQPGDDGWQDEEPPKPVQDHAQAKAADAARKGRKSS